MTGSDAHFEILRQYLVARAEFSADHLALLGTDDVTWSFAPEYGHGDLFTAPEHRNLLYVALFLHDIAKGRPEDHSIAGAEVARRLCPRLGLNASETETVAWLVRYHLVMSNTAFRRDIDAFLQNGAKQIIDDTEE